MLTFVAAAWVLLAALYTVFVCAWLLQISCHPWVQRSLSASMEHIKRLQQLLDSAATEIVMTGYLKKTVRRRALGHFTCLCSAVAFTAVGVLS